VVIIVAVMIVVIVVATPVVKIFVMIVVLDTDSQLHNDAISGGHGMAWPDVDVEAVGPIVVVGTERRVGADLLHHGNTGNDASFERFHHGASTTPGRRTTRGGRQLAPPLQESHATSP